MSDKTVTIEGPLGFVSGTAGGADVVSEVARVEVARVDDVQRAADVRGVDAASSIDAVTNLDPISAVAESTLDPIAEIAAALDAGRLDPDSAIELIIDHSLDGLGASWLSPDERVSARAQILTLVAQDPHLAGLRARLGSVELAAYERGPQS